ncbi:hypothetical protein [Pseudarthrobacter sulfonivorans]|uniref:hypothetical protein n=1 Tax=Pseudarthrobacter sulfonivorans TaxID=121292 RepID=UPI0021072A87|nr:hypothetical protein [Pseudarthrobacter sulfonivorans]
MAISTLSRKLLWGRAASHCAMPSCRRTLAHQSGLNGDAVLIGEEAHIVAKSPDGPRGESPLSPEQRDEYSNLILLCPTDHALIDKAPEDFSVGFLLDMKAKHEAWVKGTLGAASNPADEKWAALVDDLTARLSLDTWHKDVSAVLSGGEASMSVSTEERLRACLHWIATRPWPKGHDDLRQLIETIGHLINELLSTFSQHSDRDRLGARLRFKAFYKIPVWDDDLYASLLSEYKEGRQYLADLVLELTRYVNLFSDVVRDELDPEFRDEEGYATLIIEGDILRFDTYVPRFTQEEASVISKSLNPFQDFAKHRSARAPRFSW